MPVPEIAWQKVIPGQVEGAVVLHISTQLPVVRQTYPAAQSVEVKQKDPWVPDPAVVHSAGGLPRVG